MSDRELKRWASDQLHELLGFSQGYLADYVLSLARKERTVAGLVKALGEADVPGGERTQRFARELIERTPRARADASDGGAATAAELSLIHISEPTRPERISYAVFCLKKKK